MATLSPYQRDILIRTALGEARGEGVEGMADVIQTIFNRANSGKYSSDPAAVALQPYQYSTWNKGEGGNKPQQFKQSDPIYKEAERALDLVLSGDRPDYTGGSLFYHTPAVNPSWSSAVNRHGTIERNGHIFYPSQPVPPMGIPNTVGTLTDTVPPRAVPPVTPTSIPPTVELARALNSGNMTSPAASFYNGMFPQQPAPLPEPQAIQSNPSRANDLTYSGTITDTVNRSQSGQSQTLADALQAFINKPSAPPMPMGVGQSYAGQDGAPGIPSPPVPYSGGTTIASIPTSQATLPKLPPSTLGLPPQSYAGQDAYKPVPYSGGTTVASVPTSPPPLPPMPGPMNNIGSMPSMASMQSLQMPAPTVQGPSNGIGSMPSMADMAGLMMPKPVQTASLDYLPGPSSMPKDQSRLQPSFGLPMNIPPEFQVGTALDTSPFNVGMGVPLPRPRPTPPTMPIPRPAMPTAQVPMPTSNLLRPLMQPPLQVAVNGANSYSGSSSGGGGGGSSPAPRYEFQGREVTPQQTLRYDPDTNKFNTVTVYR